MFSYNDGGLIYIGKTGCPIGQRLNQQKGKL